MSMKTVVDDIIYDLNGNLIEDTICGFGSHVPKDYRRFLDFFHHVDTHLRRNTNGELRWRVQGYFDIHDFEYALTNYSEEYEFILPKEAMISMSEGKFEIWTLGVPYVE